MSQRFHRVRISGYLLSMAGTCFLAIPAFRNLHGDPELTALWAAGLGLSLAGIGMRWRSHDIQRRADPDG